MTLPDDETVDCVDCGEYWNVNATATCGNCDFEICPDCVEKHVCPED